MGRQELRDKNFFDIAFVISRMSTCNRAKHGAVIVNSDNRIVCTGYNGSLPGEPHCTDVGCDIVYELHNINGESVENSSAVTVPSQLFIPHCRRTIHAERNALAQAAKYGVSVNGCRIYVTAKPCSECQKHLSASGVSVVIPNKLTVDSIPEWLSGVPFHGAYPA